MSSPERGPAPEKMQLLDLHQRHGARWRNERGIQVPATYGDGEAEIAAVREGCGLLDLSWSSLLELQGADRHRLLNGLVTCDVVALQPGQGIYGFFTSREGKVLSDLYLMALEDRLWLELPASTGSGIREQIESHRVIDDVTVHSLGDMLPLAMIGPGAGALLGVDDTLVARDVHHRGSVVGTEVELSRRLLFGVEVTVLWIPAAIAEMFVEDLLAQGSQSGLRLIGLDTLEMLRLAAGVGRWGVDFGEDNLANETGLLDQAVDFEKGCYLGQEIVARIHYRGKPSSQCCGLRLEGLSEEPRTGLSLSLAGRACGVLSSVGRNPQGNGWLGIAMLSRDALESGGPLAVEGGGEARLRR